ncbi:MAG: argininosuccinate synthase [Chloroflexi bacterium]|nr:argininosuccinate synthase [Chloroflexota bacterium]MCL5110954.1 argininosuccinate synthase [Chloroflexota bacterium]
MAQRVVLAYSGGLDTSVCIKWLQDHYDAEVITLTIDLGANDRDLGAIQAKAVSLGAKKAIQVDARSLFVNYFIFPALQAGAIYEEAYPLATALGRPLIAKLLVDVAREEGAVAVAHGSTGKGNDQVRFDVSVGALAPELKVIAPVREWGMSREEEIEYAREHDIPVPVTVASPYSTDVNLWGRSIECGVLEDPWNEPPAEVYEWTTGPAEAPAEPQYVEIGFEHGVPVSLGGEPLDGVSLIAKLNELGGAHGVGRIDHVENRLVGIKSREIYEAPAAMILHAAHRAMEGLTLTKDQARFKAKVATEYADLIYNGLWFSSLHQDLAAYVASSERHVGGVVRVRLHKGTCQVVGRQSPKSLYSYQLATYDRADKFDHRAAEGFIKLFGLPLRTQAAVQLLTGPEGQLSIMPPKVSEDAKKVEEGH